MTYRVDVIIEGAVESMEDYPDLKTAQIIQTVHIRNLTHELSNKDWQVDIYDTRPYPPEPVHEYRHEVGDAVL